MKVKKRDKFFGNILTKLQKKERKNIGIYVFPVKFVEDLMAHIGIDFSGDIRYAFVKKLFVYGFHAFSVCADGILRAGDEKNGEILTDIFKPIAAICERL